MTDIREITARAEDKIIPILAEKGFELFELKIKRRNGTINLEMLVDKPKGGISIEECSNINKEIYQNEDILAILGEDFSLEVSSPGLDRPLKNERDFYRVLGAEIDVYLSDKIQEKLQHGGKLVNIINGEILLETKDGNVNIPIAKINKALQRV